MDRERESQGSVRARSRRRCFCETDSPCPVAIFEVDCEAQGGACSNRQRKCQPPTAVSTGDRDGLTVERARQRGDTSKRRDAQRRPATNDERLASTTGRG